jgi:hypothetical protein
MCNAPCVMRDAWCVAILKVHLLILHWETRQTDISNELQFLKNKSLFAPGYLVSL